MSHSSVQILVKSCTVSNLLLQLINVLAYVEGYTSDKIVHVWFFDDNVKYGWHFNCILLIEFQLSIQLSLYPSMPIYKAEITTFSIVVFKPNLLKNKFSNHKLYSGMLIFILTVKLTKKIFIMKYMVLVSSHYNNNLMSIDIIK